MSQRSRITAIKAQENKPHRYSIFIDDQFAAGVSEEVIANLQLQCGQSISPERLEQIVAAEQDSQTREAALDLLEYRPRTRRELIRRLHQKDLPAQSIQRVIERLATAGLVDDQEFARQMITSLARNKNLSKKGILNKLREAGLDRDIAENAIQEQLSDYDDRERAREAAAQQMRHLDRLDPSTQRRRLYSYLQRRGFQHHLTMDAIEEVLSED